MRKAKKTAPQKPITREYIHSLRGKFAAPGALKELEASRARDREREEKKINLERR